MHPATLTERADQNGPIAWILLIPTTHELMQRFLSKEITEQQLFDLTPTTGLYTALYLCSALVLPEFRGKGIARQLTCDAIRSIKKDHPLEHLFFWAFSEEGDRLASVAANELQLPLHKRPA
jgi:GNAT superfamily N-acetyltransferase